MRIPILMLFWLLCLPLEAQVCGPGASLEFDGTDDHVLVPYDLSFPTERRKNTIHQAPRTARVTRDRP